MADDKSQHQSLMSVCYCGLHACRGGCAPSDSQDSISDALPWSHWSEGDPGDWDLPFWIQHYDPFNAPGLDAPEGAKAIYAYNWLRRFADNQRSKPWRGSVPTPCGEVAFRKHFGSWYGGR